MKFRMHILEDPSQLSERAQDLLRRTGRRECPIRFGLPIELWQVRDHAGRIVPAPMDLIIRLEGLEQRFAGLRYEVQHSWVVNGERYETCRGWECDHLGVKTGAWQDPRRGGWDILYEPQLVLQHPRTSPARHTVYYRMTARYRVWLAKRHLPAPLVPLYLGVWVALTVARTRSVAGLKAWFAGFSEGIRTSGGPRRPMRWRTVWRLTRLGRPPVI